MMRKSPTSSMQKTYDECYLICSTAIYFEGQNNEAEALRAWRNALDQIYYHNAYKIPSNFTPRTETDKALHDSLRSMELQCKERVDLLEALKQSRQEAEEETKHAGSDGHQDRRDSPASTFSKRHSTSNGHTGWLGGDTVPPTRYDDIPRPSAAPHKKPAHVTRPSYASTKSSSEDTVRATSTPLPPLKSLAPPTSLDSTRARTPSPEKKSGGMLKTLRANPKEKASSKMAATLRSKPPTAAARAATQVWSGPPQSTSDSVASSSGTANNMAWDPYTRKLVDRTHESNGAENTSIRPPSPSDYSSARGSISSFEDFGRTRTHGPPYPDWPAGGGPRPLDPPAPPTPPPHAQQPSLRATFDKAPAGIAQLGTSSISYMKEYPNHPPLKKQAPPIPPKGASRNSDSDSALKSPFTRKPPATSSTISRKTVPRPSGVLGATSERQKSDRDQYGRERRKQGISQRDPFATFDSSPDIAPNATDRRRSATSNLASYGDTDTTSANDDSADSENPSTPSEREEWDKRVKQILSRLPKGVDETAAKQILNEIVIQGDEVHWDDVAGLEVAKSALKETVVYPFLRPDLFMGLREPARGMLLFGPPGTGKTMLARAVATESKSIFFAISASSLTSKFLGESEKLVRALFVLAKTLAPSIIFVDEIDSLLGARGGGSEHEATRRIKTEFLIQWSDLQKAAAGREDKDSKGDATRVLVLAATNLPWAIDEAARRRFVRRQYIPLPENWVREKQLRTLLSAQKHNLSDRELKRLVDLTDGYSGSDITALAKDAAMGPLRSLGERLLHMSPDEIRPIGMEDFRASLVNIRPSVSKQGLKEFEDWAKEFGERGG